MGRKFRKNWDLPRQFAGALALLSGCFFLGGLAGCLFAALADGQSARELSAYLADYLLLARDGGLPADLGPLLWERMKYLLAALALGITALGVPGIPVLMAARGFFLSFSVGCFCRVFGAAGLLPAFALFGLPALLWAPALFVAGVQALGCAGLLLRRTLGRESGGGLLPPDRETLARMGLSVGLTLGCGLMEYWVVPVLLEACARAVL